MAAQAALHLGARGLSVMLSFTLFAWVGKILSPTDAVHAFQLMFVLGFAVAASRACLHLSARIDGVARAAERLRSLHAGFSSQMWLLLPLGSLVLLCIWLNTRDLLLALLALLIFVPAAFDTDAVRSVIGRPSFFAVAFSLGSALAFAALASVLPPTLNGVVMAFLIQWLPVCAMNVILLRRHRRLLALRPPRTTALARVLLAASFDGIVLNAAFFGLFVLQTQVALDISLINRIFVAALPLLPLLMHWSNSPEFPRLCERLGLSNQLGFALALIVSGLVFGFSFATFYHRTNDTHLNPATILGFSILLSTFSIYFSRARFSEGFLRSSIMVPVLLGILSFFLGTLMLLGSGTTVLLLTILQGCAFLIAAYLMNWLGKTASNIKKTSDNL